MDNTAVFWTEEDERDARKNERIKKPHEYPEGSQAKVYALQAQAYRSEMWMWITFCGVCVLVIVFALVALFTG